MVVFVVIPTTILLTLFASWPMGYTINRVSLFALIFSIGILVDDAIVVVENIDRHWAMRDGRNRLQAAIEAVAEVGNPTIVATLTVIAALLPMMFVSGLMGPYMSPIPANASAAMLFSFFVAVVVTPWLMVKLRRGETAGGGPRRRARLAGRLARLYRRVAVPLLAGRGGDPGSSSSRVGVATLRGLRALLHQGRAVKLLPFDNKSEVQVVVDLPRGTSLEATERMLMAAADRLGGPAGADGIQAYAGTAAPFNFNGLVRHSYLRSGPSRAICRSISCRRRERERASHAIALDIRRAPGRSARPPGTAIGVVEVPPGPPVLATLLAEVYGPDADARRAAAARAAQGFPSRSISSSMSTTRFASPDERLRFAIDHESLEFHGVEEQAVYDTIAALMGGVSVGYSHRGEGTQPDRDRHPAAEGGAVSCRERHAVDARAGARPGRRPAARRRAGRPRDAAA